jgi:hypothetical protein
VHRADLRLTKVLPLGERRRLYLNFEAFNVTNSPVDTSLNFTAFTERAGVLTHGAGFGRVPRRNQCPPLPGQRTVHVLAERAGGPISAFSLACRLRRSHSRLGYAVSARPAGALHPGSPEPGGGGTGRGGEETIGSLGCSLRLVSPAPTGISGRTGSPGASRS